MASRQTYYASVDTANSTTSTSWQTQTSITFTPDANKAYVILAQFQYANGTSFTASSQFKLDDGTTDFQLLQISGRNDGTNYFSTLMMTIYPSTASPSSKTYAIKYRSETGSTAAKIKNARIIAIRLESDDQYSETTGTAATTSGSYTDRITITNSASGTNNFVAIGCCEFLHSSAGEAYGSAKLILNGTDYGIAGVGDGGSVGYQAYCGLWEASLANSNTAKLSYRSVNGNSVTIRNARLLLLKSSNFPGVFFSGQQTQQTRANTAYADAHSYSPTLNGTADYLVLGVVCRDYSNTTDIGYNQFVDSGTTIEESYNRVASTSHIQTGAAMRLVTSVSSGSRTGAWQHKSSSSGTVGSDEMSIAYLQLTDVSGGTGSAAITQGANTVSAAGALAIAGAGSLTQAANTVSAAGAVAIVGSASITQAAQTTSATGALAITGSAALTQADQSIIAAGGSTIFGSADLTQDGNTVSATGSLPISGAAAITQSEQSVSGAGTLPIVGAVGATQAAQSLAATGALAIVGSAAPEQAGDTIAAAGGAGAVGSAALTQAANTVSAIGTLPIAGSAAITQSSDSVSAAGALAISGSASIAQAAQTVAGTGALAISGTVSAIQGSDTISAAGTVGGVVVSAVQTIFTVPAESRLFAVANEARLFAVSAETRTFQVPAREA